MVSVPRGSVKNQLTTSEPTTAQKSAGQMPPTRAQTTVRAR